MGWCAGHNPPSVSASFFGGGFLFSGFFFGKTILGVF
jgi:hypothetical protein